MTEVQRKAEALVAAATLLNNSGAVREPDPELVEFSLAEAAALQGEVAYNDKSPPALSPTLAGIPYERFIRYKFLASISGALAGRNLGEDAAGDIVDWVIWNPQRPADPKVGVPRCARVGSGGADPLGPTYALGAFGSHQSGDLVAADVVAATPGGLKIFRAP